MGRTNNNDFGPDYIGSCGPLTGLVEANFKFDNGHSFCIDNENEDSVILEVKFVDSDTFITKKFWPGTNPYLIKEVKANAVLTADQIALLKWGR